MQQNLPVEIAAKLVAETFLADWRLYLLMGCLTIIGTFAGSWLAGYAKKRGESLATKADFAQLLAQVQQTTRTTEEIKSVISHEDWAIREWKVIRRVKLEELLTTAHSITHFVEREKNRLIFGAQDDESPDPGDRLSALAALYFPELVATTGEVFLAECEARRSILHFAPQIASAITNGVAPDPFYDAFHKDWVQKYQALRSALSSLELECAAFVRNNVMPAAGRS